VPLPPATWNTACGMVLGLNADSPRRPWLARCEYEVSSKARPRTLHARCELAHPACAARCPTVHRDVRCHREQHIAFLVGRVPRRGHRCGLLGVHRTGFPCRSSRRVLCSRLQPLIATVFAQSTGSLTPNAPWLKSRARDRGAIPQTALCAGSSAGRHCRIGQHEFQRQPVNCRAPFLRPRLCRSRQRSLATKSTVSAYAAAPG